MALTKAQASVIIFSWCAGVMYSTLFTMPYLLIANYHSLGTVRFRKSLIHRHHYSSIHVFCLVRAGYRWSAKARAAGSWTWYRCGYSQQHGIFGAVYSIDLHGHNCYMVRNNDGCCINRKLSKFLRCHVRYTSYVFRFIK